VIAAVGFDHVTEGAKASLVSGSIVSVRMLFLSEFCVVVIGQARSQGMHSNVGAGLLAIGFTAY
jgi:hypothetical protein